MLKQRDSKCGQSLSPSRRVELPDIIPKQVKKRKLHTHTLFLGFRYHYILSQEMYKDVATLETCAVHGGYIAGLLLLTRPCHKGSHFYVIYDDDLEKTNK